MELVSRRSFIGAIALAAATSSSALACGCSSPSSEASIEAAVDDSSAAAHEALDQLVTSFVVMSDTHIDEELEMNCMHFTGALEDIRSFEPAPATVVIVGDITDGARLEQYELARSLCARSGFDFDENFVKVMGNHDQFSSDFDPSQAGSDAQYIRFMEQVGVNRVYYDCEIDGQHFICLGPDENLSGNWIRMNFSPSQMEWLKELLDDDERRGRPSFVFCHEPLLNTVRNTGPNSWAASYSLEDSDELLSVLNNRPNVLIFTGHTHLYPDIAQPDQGGPLFVNDGAVGPAQRTPGEMNYPDGFNGSFAWLVSVYSDRVVLKARDFLAKSWISELERTYYWR